MLTKKDPEDGLVAANDKPARQKLNSSSDIGSKQLNEFASSEVNTFNKKRVPDEPDGKPPDKERRN